MQLVGEGRRELARAGASHADVLGDRFQTHDLIRRSTRESAQLLTGHERLAVETGIDQKRVQARGGE